MEQILLRTQTVRHDLAGAFVAVDEVPLERRISRKRLHERDVVRIFRIHRADVEPIALSVRREPFPTEFLVEELDRPAGEQVVVVVDGAEPARVRRYFVAEHEAPVVQLRHLDLHVEQASVGFAGVVDAEDLEDPERELGDARILRLNLAPGDVFVVPDLRLGRRRYERLCELLSAGKSLGQDVSAELRLAGFNSPRERSEDVAPDDEFVLHHLVVVDGRNPRDEQRLVAQINRQPLLGARAGGDHVAPDTLLAQKQLGRDGRHIVDDPFAIDRARKPKLERAPAIASVGNRRPVASREQLARLPRQHMLRVFAKRCHGGCVGYEHVEYSRRCPQAVVGSAGMIPWSGVTLARAASIGNVSGEAQSRRAHSLAT